jgi:hypothetical protein
MAEKEKQDDSYRVDIGDDKRPYTPPRPSISAPVAPVVAGPSMAIMSYCGASILMTLTNKYVLSGYDFNLNFMLLAIQVKMPVNACTGI